MSDHPKSADCGYSRRALVITAPAKDYNGVDCDWQEAINRWFGANSGGEQWLATKQDYKDNIEYYSKYSDARSLYFAFCFVCSTLSAD